METLEELNAAWIDKFQEIKALSGERKPTGPFLSVRPQGYDPEKVPSILYVGKANYGWWSDLPADELKTKTTEFLRDGVLGGGYSSRFWSFARHLSKAIAKRGGVAVGELQNLVWTNVFKIGLEQESGKSSNPHGHYYTEQRALAAKTLKAEIAEYQPALVMLVTREYGEDIIWEVFADDPDTWAQQDEPWMRWRPRGQSQPAVVWTPHPERKPKAVTEAWIEKACSLVCP